MNSKTKGDIAELGFAKAALRKGMSVSFPFGDNERYDLILDKGDSLKKVQVKKGLLKDGVIKFSCSNSVRTDNGKITDKTYGDDEIDAFGVHCPETGRIYYVPVESAPKTEMHLRLRQTENGQEKGVNWAENYTLQ